MFYMFLCFNIGTLNYIRLNSSWNRRQTLNKVNHCRQILISGDSFREVTRLAFQVYISSVFYVKINLLNETEGTECDCKNA